MVLGRYRTEGSEHALAGWYDHLRHEMGAGTARQLVAEAARAYPAPPLEAGDLPPDVFLDVEADGRPNLEHVLASALVVAAAGRNPGFAPFAELFEAPELISDGTLDRLWANAEAFFESQPRFGPDHQTLVALLQAPARHDGSLAAQIEFILDRWGDLIDETLRRHLLRAKDHLREEQAWRPGGPAGPAQTPDFGGRRRPKVSLMRPPMTGLVSPVEQACS